MSVYVDHAPAGVEIARTVAWARLWADTPAEGADFATRLGVAWANGQASAVIAEGARRPTILMGAIPLPTAQTAPRAVEVAA
jgi:hypothetical protein